MISKRAKRRMLLAGSIVALLVVAVVVAVYVRASSKEVRVGENREAGMAAYVEGDYRTALRELSTYLRHEQEDVEALTAFADARSKVPVENNRHVGEAIGLYRAALAVDPTYEPAMSGLLPLYERTGRRVEWMELAEQVLEINPDHIDALRLRSVGHYLGSDFDAAMPYMTRLMEIEPVNLQWRAMYIQLLRQQNVSDEEILATCDQWDEEYDGDGRFRLLKAQLLADAGRGDAAREEARRAAEIGTVDPEVFRRMVSLLDALQMTGESTDLIVRTTEQLPDEQWPSEALVRRYWQVSRIAEALDVIETVEAEHDRLAASLLQWKGLLLAVADREEEAREVVAELDERAMTDAEDRDATRAWAMAVGARLNVDTPWAERLGSFQSAVSLAPRDAVLLYLLGEAFMSVGEYEMAGRMLEEACRTDPNWLSGRVALAETYLRRGMAEEALQISAQLLRRVERRGVTIYTLFARSWLASGQPTDAVGLVEAETGEEFGLVRLLERLHQVSPGNAELMEVLAHAAARYGRPDVFSAVADDAVRAEDPRGGLILSLARISQHYGLGLEDELLAKAEEIDGPTLASVEFRAFRAHAAGDEERGLAEIEEGLRAIPRDRAGELERQRLRAGYLAAIDHRDAPAALRRLLELDDKTPRTAVFVLSQSAAWQNRDLIARAVDRLSEIVGEDAPRAVLARGRYVMRFQEDDPAALADAQMAVSDLLQRTPQSLPALRLMAQLYMAGDRPEPNQAIRFLQRAVRHHPDEPDLYLQLIPMLQRQGDFASAETYLHRLRNLTGDGPGAAEIHRAQVGLWESQGNFEEALASMDRLVSEERDDSMRVMYILRLHRAGKHHEAEMQLRELLSEGRPDETVLAVAAEIFANLGRIDEGLNLLEEMRGELDQATHALMLGRFYQHVGRFEQARDEFERALDHDPEHLDTIVQYAGLNLQTADYRAAYQMARRGLEIDPKNSALQSTLVLTSMELGEADREQAMRLLDQIDPSATALRETLRVYQQLRQAERAGRISRSDLAAVRRLTEDYPQFPPAWRLAVMYHAQADEVDEAIRLARQATGRLPHLPEPAEMATHLLVQHNRLSEAAEMALEWRRRSMHRPLEPDLFLASIALDQNRPRQAADYIEPHASRILAQRDQHPQRAMILMRAWLDAGHIDRAVAQFRPLFGEDDAYRTAWLEIAGRLSQRNARRAIEKAEELFGTDSAQWRLAVASAWHQFGRAHQDQSALAHADRLAERAGDRDQAMQVGALLLRAQISEAREEPRVAEGFYREALSIDPENVVALNNLAYMLASEGRECEEALTLAERAREQMPELPEIMDTHAFVLLCLGRPGEAEAIVRQALEHRPEMPEFLATLGLALAAQQQWDEAESVLTRLGEAMAGQTEVSEAVRLKHDRLRRIVEAREMEAAAR